MAENIRIKNYLKLSNTKISAMRMREILINHKDILKEDKFLNLLYQIRKLTQFEFERAKKVNIDMQLRILKDKEISIITFKDSKYPFNLKSLPDAPPILYFKGRIISKDNNAVAIVGTRRATEYGKTVARNLAKELSCRGITIISGLARGIDTQAHLGALEGNGRTIAVMGTGIDRVYPPGNKNLAAKIITKGLLMTELPPFSPPLRYHFPSRNRIISGLSKVVVAIQAPLKSGVFSTVKWALDYGRDVYALPGDITTEVSKGTNRLIKMGAIPITGYKDILDNTELEIDNKKEIKQKKIINLSEDEKRLYDLIEVIPKTIDKLAHESNMNVEKILNLLIHLEIKDLVREVSGKRFIKENI